jgi:hypothetical protein
MMRSHLFRILEEGFTPTVEDILRSRVRTTGIVELGFRLNFDKRELNFQVKMVNSNLQFVVVSTPQST